MIKKTLILAALTAPFMAISQYESMMQVGTQMGLPTLQGTARFVGSGGVISSVGGDLSNLSTNPAGLGMFSRTEISFTPVLGIHNVHNNYQFTENEKSQGTVWDNNRTKFFLNSVGVVIANRKSDKATLRASNVIIGVNRTADFNRTIDFGVSQNNVYSYSNYLSDIATYFNNNISSYPRNGFPVPNDYYNFDNLWNQTLIARNAELISYSNADTAYIDPTPYFSNLLNVNQFGQHKISGGITELSFAWAGNFKDKFYIGASMGIPFISYKSELVVSEDNNGAGLTHNVYGKYNYMELLQTDQYSGVGVNLKLGGLVKLSDKLKISAYMHTPTYYEITNDYIVGLKASYEQRSDYTATQDVPQTKYNMITPFKFGGGLSYMLGRMGFIGAEYEFNNLTNTNVSMEANPNGNSYVNATLNNNNRDFHIFRLGTEIVVPNFETGGQSPMRVRLGYNYRTSPKASAAVYHKGDQEAQTFTAGLGFRGETFSVDLAYMKSQYRHYEYLYGYDGQYGQFEFGSANWTSLNQFMATLNFRFK